MSPRITMPANKLVGRQNYLIFILFFSLFTFHFSFAQDFGLAINQSAAAGNYHTTDNSFEYRADILPRFSVLFGETGSFIISGGLTLGYDTAMEDKEFYYVPELLRTEFAVSFGTLGVKAGRIPYSDPLNFTAEGLFDGLQFTQTSATGAFSLSCLYTGLLYKKNMIITMTEGEEDFYYQPLDYDNFWETYLAPRRLLVSLDWLHLSIAERIGMKIAVIGQFDLNDDDNNKKINTQYYILKTDIPVNRFLFELGGNFQLAQTEEEGIQDTGTGYAGVAGINWMIPANFSNRLSLTARYASGGKSVFIPVINKYYAHIFQPKMSALTVLGLNYSARVSQKLGAGINAVYFIRSDTQTVNNYSLYAKEENTLSDNKLLGAEFFGKVTWSPVSDVQFNFGGGAFVPAMGDVWKDEKPQWRADLSVVLGIL